MIQDSKVRTIGRIRAFVWTTLALVLGLGIAWMDSRPHWDDTGVTVAAVLAASVAAGLTGLRPWIAALCVAGPLTAVLAWQQASAAVVVAMLGFGGAFGGWLLRRSLRGGKR